jgi:1,4-alpha-glucan branching enzyme
MMIAEESSNWPNLTGNTTDGLGFSMKWDMGWMNDTLSYVSTDPIYRKYEHNKLTFSMMYAFGERYAMPISHDEVVHGKRSLINKMPLDYEWKFAGVRAFMGYMMTHPGKKLMFMGSEIGQFREWDYEGAIEWFLLDYESHAKLQYYFAKLNHFYLETPELWENDGSWEGFQWINADDADNSVLTYRRIGDADKDGKRSEMIVAVNFTPVRRDGYRLHLPEDGEYREVFNSDMREFGGFGDCNQQILCTYETPNERLPFAVDVTLPPMSAVFFKKMN